MTAIAAIVGARAAFLAIELRPGQLTGKPLAALAILLSLVTLAVSATVLLHLNSHDFADTYIR